ncbi:hypothetical protein [Nodosilinea sp. FACHB-141]|nr:hypothetical protein [Nodosilinea sp. FACHB-141]
MSPTEYQRARVMVPARTAAPWLMANSSVPITTATRTARLAIDGVTNALK